MSSRYEVKRWEADGGFWGMWFVYDHATQAIVANHIHDHDWAHLIVEGLENHGTVRSDDDN